MSIPGKEQSRLAAVQPKTRHGRVQRMMLLRSSTGLGMQVECNRTLASEIATARMSAGIARADEKHADTVTAVYGRSVLHTIGTER